MKTVKVKTADLTGIALDWAVGLAHGWKRYDSPCRQADGNIRWTLMFDTGADYKQPFVGCYHPSTDWSQGGPIIDQQGISTAKDGDGRWRAGAYLKTLHHYGTNPLIAAMRCYVMSQLGDEIEIPQELFE